MLQVNKIHKGDCLELFEQLPDASVKMVLTDPPYGISYKSNMGEEGFQKEEIANDGFEDWLKIMPKWIRQIHRVLEPGGCLAMFCAGGGPVAALPHAWLEVERRFGKVDNVVVWDRVDMGLGWRYRPVWESIIIAHKELTAKEKEANPEIWNGEANQTNILRQPRIIPKAGDHPTPKPVPLLGRLIEHNTNEGDLILDPFSGSGSTAEAAHLLKRDWLAFEINDAYFKMGTARMAALMSQPSMF